MSKLPKHKRKKKKKLKLPKFVTKLTHVTKDEMEDSILNSKIIPLNTSKQEADKKFWNEFQDQFLDAINKVTKITNTKTPFKSKPLSHSGSAIANTSNHFSKAGIIDSFASTGSPQYQSKYPSSKSLSKSSSTMSKQTPLSPPTIYRPTTPKKRRVIYVRKTNPKKRNQKVKEHV